MVVVKKFEVKSIDDKSNCDIGTCKRLGNPCLVIYAGKKSTVTICNRCFRKLSKMFLFRKKISMEEFR